MKSALELLLTKWSYRVNSTKKILELSYKDEPVLVLHLKALRNFTADVFPEEVKASSTRESQIAQAFLTLYKKRYATTKNSLRDFNKEEKKCLVQIGQIIDDLNGRYPDFKLNYERYLSIHFIFYAQSFNTAPKVSFFVTDNAIIRTTKLMETFNSWPSQSHVENYFKNNISPASPKFVEAEDKKPKRDIRLVGRPIYLSRTDIDTPLKDNDSFQELKGKIFNDSATYYEAVFVQECYIKRGAVETMDNRIPAYILKLKKIAKEQGIELTK